MVRLQFLPTIMTTNIPTHRVRVSVAAPATWNTTCEQLMCVALLGGDARALDRRRAG